MKPLSFLCFLVFLSLPACYGQVLTQARTDVYYDSGSNTVYQISSASIDYSTEYYYSLTITSYLRKNGFTAAYGYGSSDGGSYASSYAATPGESGSFFDTISYYYLQVMYQTYEVLPGCGNCYDWYDPYDYSYIEQTGDSSSSGPSYSAWTWWPPIVVVRTYTNSIQLGTSGGGAQLPSPPSVFDVKLRSFIPPTWVNGPDTCFSSTYGVQGAVYHGDGRSFNPYTWDVRSHSEVMLVPSEGTGLSPTIYNYTGLSKRYAFDAVQPNGSLQEDSVLNDCHYLDSEGFASTSNMHVDISGGAPTAGAHMYGYAQNPVAPLPTLTPSIDWDFTVSISAANPSAPTYNVLLSHDCYPAFELYINNTPVYTRLPTDNNVSTITACLYGFGSISNYQVSGTLYY
jgi:hypothetical protein